MALFGKKEKPVLENSIWETMQAQADDFKARESEIKNQEHDLEVREKNLIARGGKLVPYKKAEMPPEFGPGEPSILEVMNHQEESLKARLQDVKSRADALEIAEKNLRSGLE